MLHHLTIEYGDDVLFSAGLTRNEFDEEARFLLAAKLYELGRPHVGTGREAVRQGEGRFPPVTLPHRRFHVEPSPGRC